MLGIVQLIRSHKKAEEIENLRCGVERVLHFIQHVRTGEKLVRGDTEGQIDIDAIDAFSDISEAMNWSQTESDEDSGKLLENCEEVLSRILKSEPIAQIENEKLNQVGDFIETIVDASLQKEGLNLLAGIKTSY
jgi:hypothetical protein